MDRRQLLIAGLASPFAFAGRALAEGREPIHIGDMHFHLLFVGKRTPASRPLGKTMADGNATLATWSLVGDQPWLTLGRGGFKQEGAANKGEGIKWLRDEMARVKEHIAAQGLKIALTPKDVDAALAGEPHVLLSVEGATFLDDGIGELEAAYELGIRSLQLVHYVRNSIGDFQTEKPEHGGLTEFGKEVVQACNRLGILVDLAHCTSKAVDDALAVAKAAPIWSHSSVTRTRTPNWSMPVWQARQLSYDGAKAIAEKGGVIGLWALGADVGKGPESYAKRITEMVDWLGEDHVAFGTDMNALSSPAIDSFADLRRVVRILSNGMPDARVRKIAIGNYARVLKEAFTAKQA